MSIEEGLPEKLQYARYKAMKKWPYMQHALWGLIPVEVEPEKLFGLSTLGVDQYWRLYYHRAAIERWTVEELAGVLYHEINHLLRKHYHRGRNKLAEPIVWNVAGDLEINDDIRSESVKLPNGCVYPDTSYKFPLNLLAEEYYEKLFDDGHVQYICVEGDGSGSGSGPDGDNKKEHRPCGSCATGRPERWEQGTPSEQTPGISEASGEIKRRLVAEAVREQATKARGSVPAHMERWADTLLEPHVNWRNLLNGHVRRTLADIAGAVDFTYRRPSRRQSAFPGVVLPCLRRPIPQIAVVIDTSGSMGHAELGQAVAEVHGVLKQMGVPDGLSVYACDAEVHNTQRIFRASDVKLAGGGGTDMGVGILKAAAQKPMPHACIVLTDGYTPYPAEAPRGMKVVVAIIGEEQTHWAVPKYASKVVIPLKAFKKPA